MTHRLMLIAILSAAFLPGCMTHPMSAQEFREAVPGSFSAKVETYEVDRPFREVASTFEKMAPQCLRVAIETTSRSAQSYQKYTTTYTPTVVKSPERVELHVQQHVDNTIKVSEEPDGGYFLLVADAYPLGRSKTRVEVFRPSMGYGLLAKTIEGWASGNNLGCPDMTKV